MQGDGNLKLAELLGAERTVIDERARLAQQRAKRFVLRPKHGCVLGLLALVSHEELALFRCEVAEDHDLEGLEGVRDVAGAPHGTTKRFDLAIGVSMLEEEIGSVC
jgi:hypothetical protein